MKIITPGRDPRQVESQRISCAICKCIFDIDPEDCRLGACSDVYVKMPQQKMLYKTVYRRTLSFSKACEMT